VDDLQLALFQEAGADILSLASYLALSEAERVAADVSPSWSSISLLVACEEQWGPRVSFGALGVIVDQLPQARARLGAGDLAVIRSGVFDVANAVLLILQPTGDQVVAAFGTTDDLLASGWLPHERFGDELYAFVAKNRQAMLDAMPAAGTDLSPQTLDRVMLTTALEREERLGKEVIALIGRGTS